MTEAMTANNPNPYLRTKILTASPEELRMMLYDGAIRFCRQAREALEKEDIEGSYGSLQRAQKIVLELSTSLDHKSAPELCTRLGALYTYIYKRLVEGNMNRDISAVDEALELLEYEKQTWQLLMEKLGESGDLSRQETAEDVVKAQQTAISSLSVDG